jgi:putative salt-induced outer membrane protein YdiY
MLAAAVLLLVPSLAAADRVTVKGAVLEGKVKAISSKHVVMETIYGKGDLEIETEDVSAIETDAPFHVYKEDDGTVVGPLVGITPAAVTVASATGAATEVPFDDVQAAPRDAGPDANWFQRRAVESPWWTSHYDVAFSATESALDTTSLSLGFGAMRERGPSRLKFGATYLRGTSQDDVTDAGEDGSEDITIDELRGFIRQEYDLTKRVFAFGAFEAEHDGVEALSIRAIPKVGLGYKLVDTETLYVAVDSGFAYVYEKFYDESLNNYGSIAFGAEHKWELPWLGSTWYSRADYLPSLTDWANDYRLRGETGLLVPIYEQLNLKASVIDDYTAQHGEDSLSNSLTTLLGLSLVY